MVQTQLGTGEIVQFFTLHTVLKVAQVNKNTMGVSVTFIQSQTEVKGTSRLNPIQIALITTLILLQEQIHD